MSEMQSNNMETEIVSVNHQPSVLYRLLPAVLPVLLISIGYVDPGKWAATVEGGAHYGFDLVALMLLFNFAAILCQYLSARISVVTGRDLAQICSDEYDKGTCLFLGIQTELSVILLDLTLVLGIAHGLNLLLGVDLSTGVFLAATDAVLFPLFVGLLGNYKANILWICMTGFVLLPYVLGVLFSQPEIPFSMNGMLIKFSGETAFTLMSLLGASIMPHNFYLHSSIVRQHQGQLNISKDTLCHDHLLAILCIFSGISLVNYVLMNSAANVFNSSGLVLLTFQDAMSLMEQVFRSPIGLFAFFLVLFASNQITALTWNLGGQAILHDFLRLDIPGWLHRATIRIIGIVPVLYCVWTSGAEGIYQLLIFTQVMVALLLPSSVIPLFRVASSRPIMGVYKISQFLEFLVLITFMGMLGLKLMFVVEMIFGNSDWVVNLRWNTGSSVSFSFVVLLITACASLCLMLWLAATPLKSASSRNDAQVWSWAVQKSMPGQQEGNDIGETRYLEEEPFEKQESLPVAVTSVESHSDISASNCDVDLPETIMERDQEICVATAEGNCSNLTFSSPASNHQEESASTVGSVLASSGAIDNTDDDSLGTNILKIESTNPIEKTAAVDGDLHTEKDDDEGDSWEPEELSKDVPESAASLSLDGSSSLRSPSGKSDDSGNGAGSLSRLVGLGRAARRQLAAVLDEFWGQLYDFHGQMTQDAKARKLDVLLGVDTKPASTLKVDATVKELSGYYPSVGGRGSDSMLNSSLYDSPNQQRVQNSIDSSYGVQRGSSALWSNHMQLLDAYVHNSSRSVSDAGERRYTSLHLPSEDSGERRYTSLRTIPSSDVWNYRPATLHSSDMAHFSQVARDTSSGYLNGQRESPAPKSPALGPTKYVDSLAFALGQKLQNGIKSVPAPGFHNRAVPINSPIQSERAYYEVNSSAPADNVGIPANAKKYHSLPDISGLTVPLREQYLSNKGGHWDNSVRYNSSVGRAGYEPSLYSNPKSRAGAPLAFDEVSPSNVYRDAFPVQVSSSPGTGSLWSRQPFEQFGVADKGRTVGDGLGNRSNAISHDTTSVVDSEVKLLQSFRHCIVKILKLEGSDWLFKPNDGADEDLIDRVAAREKILYEAEAREMNQVVHMGESQYLSSERKFGSTLKSDEACSVSSVPQCGDGCIWKADLIVSFGVWCIHRILSLSLMESRPELWGKYTYVLNRLQGVIDLAFSRPRSPMMPCFCLQIAGAYQQKSSPPHSNGMLLPAGKLGRGKCTTAAVLLEIIKDVESAISCRKGRTGTAAGDVAFPKGKENLASVLKRYKRRLSNKPAGTHEGSGSRKVPTSAPYGS